MKKYKNKTVIVEVAEITEAAFTDPHPNDDHVPGVIYDPKDKCVYYGAIRAVVGDYIVRDDKGRLYFYEPALFHALYEPVQ